MSNDALLDRRIAAVPRGVANATSIYAARAENSEIWDVEGKRYIDFAGGIAVLNVGHRHPKVIAAVQEQLELYTHTAFQVIAYEPYIALAEKLNDIAPIDGPAKTIFFTTGAEATENAVKIARAATGRPGIIAFAGGFHGRTALSGAMTGKVNPYKKGLGPFPSEIYHVPLPSQSNGVRVAESLRALDFLFAADVEPERIAAFIIEPVQGEGGFHTPDPALFEALAKMRDEYGILLIADEVQAGFARTGKMFGIEHQSMKPDLIAVAKSLAGGFPLSGVIGRADLMDVINPGGLGGTYAGSPVACAAALAVLDVIEEENLLDRAQSVGTKIRAAISAAALRNDTVGIANLRGPGAMVGFDIVDGTGNPDAAEAKRVTIRALDKGLVVLTCGTHGAGLRILVPLTASDAILDEGLDILTQALVRVEG
ncbi:MULTISPECIES: 4-aminobutyrate--2-oxoglutarate transaminase [unclassified Sphingopyxis]|jgi:4-aminobutyrate aminotransferase/(S)-3-amino-2-methylpropionate transaminase|uniref:4-aminobutyrate--2-oxoglutarate transaminase n=1 Tax=unclassified Sphingopyxis TaxID=2614943 RepID=UPI00073019BF|nr:MULTISPECIES: 4-aminobutyrate--2-oxoglutarate transaminase [unclassified Sphingopyxis]KTE18936.1 4-aminobutyrate aminotransferase [Sphingopyxis sp. H057]KTE48010.1 4-aminobutyrate aminotransferase [Sphingopyxis sp. H073]KTE48503.1 4-aminobutyrate aminotransferase [Sphingopyxis sp. H071]KTE59121.1 4-aminobutyrate aminotransferase [Sphingopyxis sp. H100]KTE62935.1 4-aminobutyrate aminotransferase [Sphingopyxis sp. H107]